MLEVIANTHNIEPDNEMEFSFDQIGQMMENLKKINPDTPPPEIRATEKVVDHLLKGVSLADVNINDDGHITLAIGVDIIIDETVTPGFFAIGQVLYDAHLPPEKFKPPLFP